MKTKILSILEKVKTGELTTKVAQEQLFVLFSVSEIFTADDIKKAYSDGGWNLGDWNLFNIENYC
ncbi:MAG: hypothetical protein OEL54_05010 [Flavobacteriaceae bacterium]|nr:hypothetical protein [Flavobacteriaceae bacterium]